MRCLSKRFLVLLFALFVASGVFAESKVMFVRISELAVKEKPSVRGKTLATVVYGESVFVMSDSKDWVQVVTGGKVTGWVPLSSLSPRKVASSKVTIDTKEIALAGRGAGAGIEKVFSQNFDEHYDLVDKIEGFEVKPEDVYSFIEEGKLNGGEE